MNKWHLEKLLEDISWREHLKLAVFKYHQGVQSASQR